MRGLKGKRIVVGGGATGIGASAVRRLTEEGASVVLGDINASALDTLAAGIAANGGMIAVQHFDLSEEGSAESLVARCVELHGGVDGVAITGADLSKATLGNDRELLGLDIAVWERTLRVNLIGHALLMRAAIPQLKAAGGGGIVSISSESAKAGFPEMPAYAASKAGMQALVRHVARIAGPANIRCNAVAPGLVLTEGAKVNLTDEIAARAVDALPLPRLGEPEDIAATIAFLLSDDGSWITGQTIAVNGGASFRD